jgi:hydroxymethylglutaryl-CoA lyase
MVRITDVTLRDGLQMEAFLPNPKKVELLRRLLPCGYSRLEVTSFANPKWVPQFQQAEEFCKEIYSGALKLPETMAFVPNARGLDRLLAFPIPWVSLFVATSETFNRKNVNQSIDETLAEAGRVIATARAAGRKTRLYVSTVFGCPYEKAIPDDKLTRVLSEAARLGPDEMALSDTIGVGTPSQVEKILGMFKAVFPMERTSLHLHDTYGLALANVLTAYRMGLRAFDGSSGGVGGCPYAKGATGNVATEKIAYVLHREGGWPQFGSAPVRELVQWLGAEGMSLSSSIAEIFEKGGSLYEIQ